MPVRSLTSSVLRWPDRDRVDQAVRTWAATERKLHSKLLRFGYFGSYARGDWGDLCSEDKQANDDALSVGARLLSAYHTGDGRKFWIITEADRSVTTVLLPEEY